MTPLEAKNIVRKHIDRWKYLATSYGWKFDIYYADNGHRMPSGNEDAAGVTFTQFQYLSADIWFNLTKLSDCNESEIEEIVVHEITHMLIAPVQKDNNEQNVEYTTTVVSRLFLGLRATQCEDPKVHTKAKGK